MSLIVKRGELPRTIHTEFRDKDGSFTLEEIHGSYGFNGPWARKIHKSSYPTEQVKPPIAADFSFICKQPPEADLLQPYMIQTEDIPTSGDALRARTPIVFGPNTTASIIKTDRGFHEGEFFRNGEKYECYYIHEGEGVLHSEFGRLPFRKEVYMIVPKGTTYRIELSSKSAYFFLIESRFPIEWPHYYMNHSGQANLGSPVFETEIELPELPAPKNERGEFVIFTKHNEGRVTQLTLGHHPFDLVGWEGALYPFIFDINNHHSISREIHAEPTHHQTFQSGNLPHNGFALCTFRKHMEGWHEKDVPAPYAHFNVDSDEVMFFCNASYGARKGIIRNGSLTFHPGGVPHSPHGKAALNSLSSRGKLSNRLAVMFDTYFESMQITEAGYKYREPDYATSWNEAHWQG